MKKKIFENAATTLTIVALLFFSTNLFGQERNSAGAKTDGYGYVDPESEPASGYWEYMSSNNETFNNAKITKWVSGANAVTATSQWIDRLRIEHTVSSSFKWDQPLQRMVPGSDLKITGTYMNVEYSTPNKVLTGIRILIDRTGAAYRDEIPGSNEILKVVKDNKQHASEVKTGFFSAPKYYRGDSKEMKLMVDCYIGTDHYVTVYTYTWVDASPKN